MVDLLPPRSVKPVQPDLPALHVMVQFGKDIPADAQSLAMLAFERILREHTGSLIEVFKEAKGDDSKLRNAMTPQQRSRL